MHPGQSRAWRSTARFLAILAGTRSGKTSWSPYWLHRELKRMGAGHYLACAPSFPLLEKALVPHLDDAFRVKLKLGKIIGGARGGHFLISPQGEWSLWGARQAKPSVIFFGHADQPDSLEAAQYKAVIGDEAGQKGFKRESYEAILRRLAIDQGRLLMPTTPYSLGWLKEEVHDRWARVLDARAKGLPWDPFDEGYEVVNFESIENPAFPLEEWERAKAQMPPWKFNLFYRGIFTRPAGAVFDCWDTNAMTCPDFVPNPAWPRLWGIDFGAPNFAAVFLACEMREEDDGRGGVARTPTGRLIAYREYRPQVSRTAAEHVRAMLRGEPGLPLHCIGGSLSEGQWRAELAAAGLPCGEPDQKEVEVMLDRVYAQIRCNCLVVCRGLKKLVGELENFSREVDDAGNVTNDLDDEPSYHGIASLRYIVGWWRRVGTGVDVFF